MAIHQIRFSCGCFVDKPLYGKMGQRDRYIDWAAREGVCDDCRKIDAADHATSVEIEQGLPRLHGSPKQVAWARTVRAALVPTILDYLESRRVEVPADKMSLYEDQVARVVQALLGKTSATWWIDNREARPAAVAQLLFG